MFMIFKIAKMIKISQDVNVKTDVLLDLTIFTRQGVENSWTIITEHFFWLKDGADRFLQNGDAWLSGAEATAQRRICRRGGRLEHAARHVPRGLTAGADGERPTW